MIEVSGVKAILTDIEGTTGSISFVKDVLFPYARERLADFVRANENAAAPYLENIRTLEKNPALTTDEIIAYFLRAIDEDRKLTPLKALQGLIWEDGYKSGAFKGHVYDDAAACMKAWKESGLPLYVYSSGSVPAQKLIFGYSERGDLTPLFSGYFDTTTGPKLEALSYTKIAKSIDLAPDEILFLSDNPGEIDAANEAGLKTILLDREKSQPADAPYKVAHDFEQISVN